MILGFCVIPVELFIWKVFCEKKIYLIDIIIINLFALKILPCSKDFYE